MKKFRFHLESYLKLKKAREQQKLGELAKVMNKVNTFRAQQQKFDDEYSELLRRQRERFMQETVSLDNVRAMYDYLGALRARRDTATRQIARLEPELQEKRTAYNAARKERRVIEILREKRRAEHMAAFEREDIATMDEFNSARTRHNSLLWSETRAKKREKN